MAPNLLVSEELVFEVRVMRNGELVTETVSVVVHPVETVKRPEGYALADWDNEQDTGIPSDADDGKRRGFFGWAVAAMFSGLRIREAENRQR